MHKPFRTLLTGIMLAFCFILAASWQAQAFTGKDVVAYARQWIGVTPYAYGGASLTSGADCSGFVCCVYEHFGVDLWNGRPDRSQMTDLGTDLSQAQPGDVLYFSDHFAIYSEDNMIVHETTYGTDCQETTISYLGQTLLAIYRVNAVEPPEPAVVTVFFDANGGNMRTETCQAVEGKLYGEMPRPALPGFRFAGWYTSPLDGTRVDEISVVTLAKNHTLYAHWQSVDASNVLAVDSEAAAIFCENAAAAGESSDTEYLPDAKTQVIAARLQVLAKPATAEIAAYQPSEYAAANLLLSNAAVRTK